MTAATLMDRLPSPAIQPPQTGAALCGHRQLPIEIGEEFVADILQPYRLNAKYLKYAQITQLRAPASSGNTERGIPILTAAGRFVIAESCYIDDTGHFNAVEFNICYNQLAYAMFGKCFETGIVDKLRFLSYEQYRRHQLQSCFIASLESRFLKPFASGSFRGELALNKLSWVGGVLFCFTAISFSDGEGVKAHGSVVLAFNPPSGAAPH
jgi:hypothetical protein